jgi:hypothetical protein
VTRIAINEALMMLRRRRVTIPVETNNDDFNATSPVDLADGGPTPEQAFAEKESRTVVIGAISRLRKSLRTVALLRELEGLSNSETARRLGLTVSAHEDGCRYETCRKRAGIRRWKPISPPTPFLRAEGSHPFSRFWISPAKVQRYIAA